MSTINCQSRFINLNPQISNPKPLRDTFEEILHSAIYIGRGLQLVGDPYESNDQHLSGSHLVGEQGLLTAVGFTNLSFHAIAIDGMTEPLLRNANEHLNRRLPFLVLFAHEYDSQREGSQRMAVASFEELADQLLADHVLPFLKCCWSLHKKFIDEI